MQMQEKNLKKWTIGLYVSLYIIMAVLSGLHLVLFYAAGDQQDSPLPYILAFAFELASAASLVSLVILDRVNKAIVWFNFALLFLLQCVGNVFYSYRHIVDTGVAKDLADMIVSLIGEFSDSNTKKLFVASVIGLPLPIIAISFIKSLVDYLRPESPENVKALQEAVAKADSLEVQVTEKQAEIEALKLEMIEASNANAVLDSDRKALTASLEALRSKIDSKEKELASILSELSKSNEKCILLDEEAKKAISSTTNAVATATAEKDTIIGHLESELASKESAYEMLMNSHKKLLENYNLVSERKKKYTDDQLRTLKEQFINEALESGELIRKPLLSLEDELNGEQKKINVRQTPKKDNSKKKKGQAIDAAQETTIESLAGDAPEEPSEGTNITIEVTPKEKRKTSNPKPKIYPPK